ncbi:MAG: hypothetical protein RJA36_1144 [Pseudomonadota bacterium]|jgi:exodeoxyribonuclease V alpha subunit
MNAIAPTFPAAEAVPGMDHAALPLSALDRAFAAFLEQQQPGAGPAHGWLAALVSHQMGRGHTCLDLQALADEPQRLLGWESEAVACLPRELATLAPSLPWIRGEHSPLVLDGARLYLRRAWQAEQDIRAALRERLARSCERPADLAQRLDRLYPPGADGLDWQKVACALAARSQLTLITGGPGTGKTTTVVRLLALLQSEAGARGQPLRIHLAAPTGKAASRLSQSIGSAIARLPAGMGEGIPTEALTLHRLLQLTPGAPQRGVTGLATDLVVVDEASMIDLEMMARLLAAVPQDARLILLGDKDQLASVEAGAVMAQLCEGADAGGYSADSVEWVRAQTGQDIAAWRGAGGALAQQTVMLRHSRRFASGSGIGRWANAVNAGDRKAVQALWNDCTPWQPGDGADVERLALDRLPSQEFGRCLRAGWSGWLERLAALRQSGADCSDAEALELLAAFGRFQLLCALRSGAWGVEALNQQAERSLGFPGDAWYAGRPVMVTRNDYHLRLMNGDIGMCLPHGGGLRVAFADAQGGVRWVLPSRLEAVETVFAMTVHKSQGSEFAHVLLVLPERQAPMLTRELLYTGITRAMRRLTLLVPQPGVLLESARQRVLRSSGLSGG